jgi:hypothetical protein
MTTVKEQYYINREEMDSNDRRQIQWLNEFEKEHPDNEWD